MLENAKEIYMAYKYMYHKYTTVDTPKQKDIVLHIKLKQPETSQGSLMDLQSRPDPKLLYGSW